MFNYEMHFKSNQTLRNWFVKGVHMIGFYTISRKRF